MHFNQPDTLIPDPYHPLDWNRYLYARANPLKYTDPTGHEVCLDDGSHCFDWNNKAFDWNLYIQQRQYVDQQAFIRQNLKETANTLGRMVYEPYNWARVGIDRYNGVCSGGDFLGLLPLLLAGLTIYCDEIGGSLTRAVPVE